MPSPPQGYTVILPGEITQSDLDPQQPPSKLTSYPLTIGKDTPVPNESNYVANDNTGNLLDIVNSDTSSTTLSALKMAIDNITMIRKNGELAMNLTNGNTWSAIQSFGAGLATTTINLNGAGAISALVSSFNNRTGAVVPASGDYSHHTMINSSTTKSYAGNSQVQVGTIKTGPNGIVFWNGFCLTGSPASGNFGISIGTSSSYSSNLTVGMGANTTNSSYSATLMSSSADYPVILTGIADASIGSLSPNTSYGIYLCNFSSSSIDVANLVLAVIGL